MLAVEELQGVDLWMTVDEGGNERRAAHHHPQTAKAGEIDGIKKAAEFPVQPGQREFLEVTSVLQSVHYQPIVSLKKLPVSGIASSAAGLGEYYGSALTPGLVKKLLSYLEAR